MKWLIASLVGVGSGVLASMGLGGGFILLVYLALFGDMEQSGAQGMNLLFFIPVIGVALIFHIKNKLIDFKTAFVAGAAGIVTVFLGFWIATAVESDLLRKLFAVFIIIAGLKDLFSKKEKKPNAGAKQKPNGAQTKAPPE